MKFNTAIAALMTLVNELSDVGVNRAEAKTLLCLLSPFAPHICEELWEMNGFEGSCQKQSWPEYDEKKLLQSTVEMAVQVGGKLKGTIVVPVDSDDSTVVEAALANEKVARLVDGGEIVRRIIVKNKLVNLIVKPKQ